jgi:hypothetical protein
MSKLKQLQQKVGKARTEYTTAVINANVEFSSLDEYSDAVDEVQKKYSILTNAYDELGDLNINKISG